MRVSRQGSVVSVVFAPYLEDGLEMLCENPMSSVTLFDGYILHEWDFTATEYINPEDRLMGTRPQKFIGSRTILRHSVVEVNIRPAAKESVNDDNTEYGENDEWSVFLYTTAGQSWSFSFYGESEARAMYRELHNYITGKSSLL